MLRSVLGGTLLVLAGCGLEVVGASTPDGEAPGSSGTSFGTDGGPLAEGGAPADGGVLPPAEPVACAATGTTCTAGLPADFQPYVLATASACPTDFEALEVVSDPVANPGACACGCAIDSSDPPTCAKGSFVPNVGSSSCDGPSNITYVVDGTGCTSVRDASGLTIVAHSQIALFPLAPGKCTTSTTTDPTKLGSKPLRLCKPSAACRESVCQGVVPAALAACVVHDGDVACLAPFTKKTLVGARPTLACGGCTSCINRGTCGPGTFRYYSDTGCASEVATRIADGVCHPLSSGTVRSFARFRYDVEVQAPRCDATSTPVASVGLDAQRTVCCR